ncbi:MAG: anaerobic ribonucleoside-triphosphate reductase [Patescibacteria group bacterium]
MEYAKIAKRNNFCHDCGKEIKIQGDDIENGVLLTYDDNGEKLNVFKCNDCYGKNKSLSNFKKCEVYSRVVGYLRPVSQWNTGKKQEYQERKEYAMKGPGGECC